MVTKILSLAMRHSYKIGFDKDLTRIEIDDVFVEKAVEKIPDLIEIIKIKLDNEVIQTTTFGKESTVLGTKILGVYDLFFGLFSLDDQRINDAFAKSEFLDVSMVKNLKIILYLFILYSQTKIHFRIFSADSLGITYIIVNS